jgi:hypothetical protein
MFFTNRHRSIILIVLLTLLAIAMVLWVFEKRLRRLEVKQKTTAFILPNQRHLSQCLFYML